VFMNRQYTVVYLSHAKKEGNQLFPGFLSCTLCPIAFESMSTNFNTVWRWAVAGCGVSRLNFVTPVPPGSKR